MQDSSPRKVFSRPQTGWPGIAFLTSLFIVLFDNNLFWQSFIEKLGIDRLTDLVLLITMGLTILLLINLVFTLVAFRWVFKPFLALILLLSASVSYFADNFGVIVDQSMIHNIFETNVSEASELLTRPLVWHLTLYAGVPILLLLITKVRYSGWKRELLMRSGVLLGSLALVGGLAFANYKEITLFGRANRSLQMYINPTYPIHSLKKVVKTMYFSHSDEPLQAIAADARHIDSDPKEVIVLVVGETARSQSFGLNGYNRDTNPQLHGNNVIDFTDVASCGTATAESLPCMFSLQGHDNYSRSSAIRSENLLDILDRTGIKVIWRDNDSGDKGVAKRVVYQDLSHQKDSEFCSEDNCYDEVLLDGFESLIQSAPGDTLVILHTKGSHGPSYYKRTPPNFKVFLPECSQDNVQDCSQQEIVNAYDNTIVYTDYILSKVIETLKKQDFETAMLYISDHGESLGENGLYLHGLPYVLAPPEQTHVPMIFWASEQFLTAKQINQTALFNEEHAHFSHDNLFHSMLGLFDVRTNSYQPELDIFATPRQVISTQRDFSQQLEHSINRS